MKPIPKAAMPVVKILRRDVNKPKTLPNSFSYTAYVGDSPRWRVEPDGERYLKFSCPMGFHPQALSSSPAAKCHFPVASTVAIDSFGRWWDGLKEIDTKKAIDAIWGKSK